MSFSSRIFPLFPLEKIMIFRLRILINSNSVHKLRFYCLHTGILYIYKANVTVLRTKVKWPKNKKKIAGPYKDKISCEVCLGDRKHGKSLLHLSFIFSLSFCGVFFCSRCLFFRFFLWGLRWITVSWKTKSNCFRYSFLWSNMLNLHAICLWWEIGRAAEDCAPASNERLARRRVTLSNEVLARRLNFILITQNAGHETLI